MTLTPGQLDSEPLWLPIAPDAMERWHVLHVKSRQEKALADCLTAAAIAHYLPLVRQVRHYGGRKATVELPLFPGYLFLRGTIDEVYQADRTHRVAQVISVADQGQLNWELGNLHQALSVQATLDPFPFLKQGVRVEVRSGPLRGLQGIVQDRDRIDRLILQVDILGTAGSLEIDGACVQPLE